MYKSGPTGPRGLVAALLAVTLASSTAACSLIEDDESGATATPTTIVVAKEIDAARLEAILPQPGSFGPEFAVDESDIWSSEDDEAANDGLDLDAAFEESCPGFEQAFDSIGTRFETQPSAQRGFSAPDGRAFVVAASSHADNVLDPADQAAMAEAVQVINLCPTALLTDDDDFQTNVTLDARAVDGYGEWAMVFELRVSMLHPNLSEPVTMTIDYLYLGVGSVTVGIFTADGLDSNTMAVAQADRAKRDAVGANLAMVAAAIQTDVPSEPGAEADPAVEPAAP